MRGVVYFGCSVRMNRGGCENTRNVAATEVENRVITALKRHLLAPEVIATAIEAYRLERQRLSRERVNARGSVERDLSETTRRIGNVMRSIQDGGDRKILIPRLNHLGARKEELEARLALTNAPMSWSYTRRRPKLSAQGRGDSGNICSR